MDREVQRAIQKKHRRDQKRKTKLAKKQSLMLDKILIKTVANSNANSNNSIHNNRINGSKSILNMPPRGNNQPWCFASCCRGCGVGLSLLACAQWSVARNLVTKPVPLVRVILKIFKMRSFVYDVSSDQVPYSKLLPPIVAARARQS